MTINERLAAILEKHPHLRPTRTEDDRVQFSGAYWGWYGPNGLTQPLIADEAHALIFRAMVEGLPAPCTLGRSIAGKWGCTPDWECANHDTPLDALLAFWKSRSAQEKP
ncbi:MAG: hypothetical protein KF805_12595 [Phycisphaeraceae bacterium]|nr:hypothetical protein [Phycisphaeraceae bacterium]